MQHEPIHPVLPYEIWAHVMQYCSPKDFKHLAGVSRIFRNVSLKYRYHTVMFNEVDRIRHPVPGTQIRDLARFYDVIAGGADQLNAVQHSSFSWRNGHGHIWQTVGPETESHRQHGQLIQNTAKLLSSSKAIKTLHLSIPRLDCAVPLSVPSITSLTVPITGSWYADPDSGALLRLFQISTLEKIELDHMVCLTCTIPEDCRQPGTSNVNEVKFSSCGPVHEDISHLLRWPKDLQVLHFSIVTPQGLNRYAYGSGRISMTGTMNALWPLENSPRDLSIEILDYAGSEPDGPVQGKAFASFTSLKRLYIPLEMLLEFSDVESSPKPYDIAPPIHLHLPSSLEEVVLAVEWDFRWFDWDHRSLPSKEAKELFAWLSGLAYYKSELFPDLHLVTIRHTYGSQKPDTHPWAFPVSNNHTLDFLKLMQSSGLPVTFD